ncbi:amidohydrolase [Iamia sp. SCSIO 61187]|uniref:amidohydrolase n=1 Tax=Iamia sp. SCSIO 61187 TaxID=2722752 RepID=UPI001C6396D4|nr:amidohydrolase [Iamia sp. SCSIO 61187]QYG91482.1 amidohydrolase [Iamia sp. SCSIO 61187]
MLDAVPALLPDLRGLYEDLHAHPELSFQEHRTAGILADRLQALGYEVTADVGRTGVVATMENGPGPTVLLRADIDALPVEEDTGLAYASTVRARDASGRDVPVAHACGHDMHAAWLVGAATVLAHHRDGWAGSLLLVVQPAEELGAGARAMLDDGLYERFGRPDVVLGQHAAPAPAGWVLHRAGPMMAASDAVEVVLHGRGGHGSAPQNTVDPAVLAASTVLRLQTIVSREVDPAETAVVTVGRLQVGTKENIIADRAELGLSIRTFQPHVRAQVLAAITRIVEGECQTAGCARKPEITEGYALPVVDNDAAATERIAAAFAAHFGPERSMPGPVATGSEDFGFFGEQAEVPSVFWFVGVTDPELVRRAFEEGRFAEDVPYNHSPRFAPVQDPSIATGVEALVTAALCWLAPG